MGNGLGSIRDVLRARALGARDDAARLELTLEVREVGARLFPDGDDPAIYSATAVGRECLRQMLAK